MDPDKDRIKVVCRIKPLDAKERAGGGGGKNCSVSVNGGNCVTIRSSDPKQQPQNFTFDQIVEESQNQQYIFNSVGLPLLQNSFLLGYNTTIMAYGQTGSGKSYTVFGPSSIFNTPPPTQQLSSSSSSQEDKSLVGLVPRIMDYIYAHIARESSNKTYSAKCSFFEIYQEKVIDLLVAASDSMSGLPVREDLKLGVFVDGLTEEVVKSSVDVTRVLGVGYNNRHVSETSMNRESSRSHAVFVLTVNRQERIQHGKNPDDFVNKNVVSRLTLVDLAGSERQKSTNATGSTLKEASQINKSLTVLGQVINSLVDGQIHVPFRDSKLTFLLRESLGGNSKTLLIATISQIDSSLSETISTLKFAQRAKNIKTKAFVNEDTSGSITALQREISSLKSKLFEYESSQHQRVGRPLAISTSSSSSHSAMTAMEIDVFNGNSNSSSSSFNSQQLPNLSGSEEERTMLLLLEMRKYIEKLEGDSNMSAELINRCNFLSKTKKDSDEKFNASMERIKFLEKALMGLKMQLKMKEKPAGSKLGSSEAGMAVAPNAGALVHTDEAMKVALETLRSEMQNEVAKYRYPLESYEQKFGSSSASKGDASGMDLSSSYSSSSSLSLSSSSSGNGPFSTTRTESAGNSYWNTAQESQFIEDFSVISNSIQNQVHELLNKVNSIINKDFVQACGITPAEALGNRELLLEKTAMVAALEPAKSELVSLMRSTQQLMNENERVFLDKEARYQSLLSNLEQSNNSNKLAIQNLQASINEKDQALFESNQTFLKVEEALRSDFENFERQSKIAVNEMMKDNAILIRKCQELDAVNQEQNALAEAALQEKAQIEGDFLQQRQLWQEADTKYRSIIANFEHQTNSVLEENKDNLSRLRSDFEQNLNQKQCEIDQLVSQLREMSVSKVDELNLEMERLKNEVIAPLERKNADLNDHISMFQSEVVAPLEARNEDLTGILARLQSEVISPLEANNTDLTTQIRQVGEINRELTKQVEALHRDITSLKQEICDNAEVVRSIASEKSSMIEQIESMSNMINGFESEKVKLTNAISSLESQRVSMMKSIGSMTNMVNSLESEKKNMAQSVNSMTQQLSSMTENMNSLEADKSNLSQQLSSLAENMSSLESEKASLTQQLSSMTEQLSSMNNLESEKSNMMAQQLSSMTESMNSLEAEKASLAQQLSSLNESMSNVEADKSNLSQQLNSLAESMNNLESEKASLTQQLGSMTESMNSLETEKNNLVLSNQQLSDSLTLMEGDKESITKSLHVLEFEKESLERSLSKAQSKKISLERVLSEVQAENKLHEENNSGLKASLEEAMRSAEIMKENIVSDAIALKDIEIGQLKMQISALETHLSELSSSNDSMNQAFVLLQAEKSDLTRQLDELSSDKADPASSSNSSSSSSSSSQSNVRQKIKLQMQVKKELEASSSLIEQLTRERDAALADLSSIRKSSQTDMLFPDKFGQVNISMRKRKAMGDANSNINSSDEPRSSFTDKLMEWKDRNNQSSHAESGGVGGGGSSQPSASEQLKDAFSNM